jgi:quercetin dioxygenase-like cupin family protein
MAVQILEHPSDGDRAIVLVTATESGGELFRFQYIARGVTAGPANHVHARQEERVEVLTGTVRCRVGGHERELRPGESITIPAGVPHAVWNAEPTGSSAIGEFRPALEAQAMLEAYFAAA